MELISWNFLLFTLIVMAVYYLLSRRAQNYWLLLASLTFYTIWSYKFVMILALATLFNYFVAQKIWHNNQKRTPWLVLGIGANLISFCFFRLADVGVLDRIAESLLSRKINLDILIPVGFAFYILQAISYLVDIANRQLPASNNLVDFALYLSYFPRLVSGPIERARVFLPKLEQPRRVDNLILQQSVTLILLGLVRKILFAEILSMNIPPGLFNGSSQYSSSYLVWGIILYAFWLYNDFAGYTDIVRGISGLFGIELSVNFQQPYFSHNFTEFWNRWHISLSHWLRDYIYLPLSRSLLRRKFKHYRILAIIIPSIVTMLISGLWHKFGFYMLAWGGLHGIYQVVERLYGLHKSKTQVSQQPLWKQIISTLLVFSLTIFAWIPFGSGSFSRALNYLATLFINPGISYPEPLKMAEPGLIILLCLVLDWFQYRHHNDLFVLHLPRPVQASLLTLVILAFISIIMIGDITVTPFIYQGF